MSMKIGEKAFKERIGEGLEDAVMRGAVSSAQERLYKRRLTASEELGNWEKWRELGEEIRQHTLTHLDDYLYQLSESVSARGGHVFFAKTKEEAAAYIQEVAQKKAAKKVVKSKSMVTEEIEMNQALEEIGCEVVESDLGEYILQVDDHEPPSHIVAPALHMTKEQIREVFHEKLGYEMSETPEDMTSFVRAILREKFLEADIGVTGCNFAVANTGSICLVTNEGNADLVTAIPKTHIAVMGMERLVPTMEELDVLVGLLCRSAVGQKLTSYISVVGPKGEGEVDGPEEFHLIIVDNGRSNILGTAFQPVLQCIRCAACINVCPVYRHVGGHSYGSIYPGPIGAVLSPLLGGYDDYQELPFASSLCAACTDACPVKIPLHELLIKHRQVIVEKEGRAPKAEMMAMKMFGVGASTPGVYQFGTKAAPVLMNRMASNGQISKGIGPLKNWTDIRDLPAPNKERFRDWFKKRQKEEQ
ncbi:LutB/LldF family L-lactate oxidation iron-sulfur protein [Bacillus safensis]|uniref:LutB/LldF family L-lactate oxidation iron-sulfur protein n=1 Tax=Bacillus safensis TaxID=561879 RepID=UPI00223857A4|nr:LutB/LldF family L-lactate oxidation iron-sulfur protein [Bacillus safensis]MCW4644113.1 LutB/LldF family L-lactate oxidation iron-sulfur protein [Bacillus safensis]MCY7565856.1 LutB/LldF family L-lactate oxidation iron-sulfur protein [Bacillus safensis]MCY7623701.1 LutB/LldF family L-lactate oxidation iron-sulfur protein [Bacillus safensis]MCY7634459.1 LutB/LldF family L-lactate oxidation iron-sulfur protein [Bacillus safensis]MCY7649763.1 LutB/LldF family L-lactate oxidation iron-sulfur p